MSASRLAFSVFIYIQLLPLLFLFHIFYLCATALWTGKPVALLIQDISLKEDGVCIPHPPGFLESTDLLSESVQDDAFFDDDAHICDNFLTDGSILLATPDLAFNTPLIVVSATSDDQHATHILDDLTIYEADITLLDAMEKVSDCALKEDIFAASYSPDEVYVIDSIEPSDSVTSLDITEQYFGRTKGPCHESIFLASPPPTRYSEEQELDVTEREETRKSSNIYAHSSSINNQDIILPRVPDGTPIFSRHTVDDKVIFPIRKSSCRHDSISFSEDIKSAFKKLVAPWAKAKEELNIDHSLSIISNFSLFKVEKPKPTVPARDPYDSWPFIRSRIQEDVARDALADKDGSIGKHYQVRAWL